MEIISSVKNKLVINAKEVRDNFDGKIFIDNPKTIEEAILLGLKIDYILIDVKKIEKLESSFPILKRVDSKYLVSSNIIESLSKTKTPQGLVAIVKFEKKLPKNPTNNFVVLENVQDPGNLGAIIRSASGTSFTDLYLINCVSPFNQKVVRSTMGNLFKVNLYQFANTGEFLTFAKNNNLMLVCATMEGENLFQTKKFDSNFGIVVGNEGNGISKEMRNYCQKTISIPMKNGLESLNVAVACSIVIYYFDNI